ncbi:nitrate/sulfonate/bicarbonate ABC transporter ATP-binding protein [Jannaschia pagri]|uniref:Nitrate/sulfonate/bicarbonate ABC transporter ATP-binding protein n=1 Tax=Jannaschia pagri TaxID=2829797 RepID=A0ABQ4NJM9_9RHOB|nr:MULTISPECIES: ABC transporter ATP-binding protein [unclassified Jannaschia]GIT90793.1 nitrate/sulfonate/bicarbonate ABC transporter ATP-binding protein [Jannaschia sp. AI_61]GIT94625.1 nitrate/sulfonate/bicarbonate ABC transporter ATP-binding protein [Jannaschia sp. AI_62]
MTAPPAISFDGSLRLGEAQVFFGVSFTLPAGAWSCVLGASGVGKSSVLRLIAGLLPEGRFDGRITTSDGAPLDGRVALMAQSDLLMPWLDVRQNVTLGARLRGTPVDVTRRDRLIDRVGLTAHAHKKPGALSGGMRQRVALARTLMEDTPVVLLDEPFSALDARTRNEMQDLAAQLLRGRTVLLVTHDPAEAARLGEHILVMEASGATAVAPAPGQGPHPVDAPATIAVQMQLFDRLRGIPA